jgi:uncharacterized protein YcaQ
VKSVKSRVVSLAEARRIAVRAQLLDGSATSGARHRTQARLLQIDPISTVAPPQHLVLWSRLGPYDTTELDRLLWEERKLFECGSVHPPDRGPTRSSVRGCCDRAARRCTSNGRRSS